MSRSRSSSPQRQKQKKASTVVQGGKYITEFNLDNGPKRSSHRYSSSASESSSEEPGINL